MSSPVIQMLMAASGKTPMTQQFLGYFGDNVLNSGSIPIGAARSDRILVAIGAIQSLTSVSIDGNAMTSRAAAGNSVILTKAWPTGTNGTFTIIGTAFVSFAAYALYGAASEIPVDTLSAAASGVIDLFAGGAVLAVGHTNNNSIGMTWSGLTADNYAATFSTGVAHGLGGVSDQFDKAISYSAAGGTLQLAAASWRP